MAKFFAQNENEKEERGRGGKVALSVNSENRFHAAGG